MKKIIRTTLCLILAACVFACKKQWDNNVTAPYLASGSLSDFLKKDPELTQFMSLVKKAGYDSVLNRQQLYTILAVKNGGFAGVDTTNLANLKKMIGMHFIPSAIYPEKMNSLRVPSLSGKYVKFVTSSGVITANNIAVTGNGDRVANGVAYKIPSAIVPLPSIYEIITSDPNYSLYAKYLKASYVQSFDPVNNIIIRYDSVGKPVYKQPYKYINTSQFIIYSKIDSEKVDQTVFIPTNAVVTKVLGQMLAARGGNQSLVIPAIGTPHAEINVGGYFIPTNLPYIGDSTIVQNYLFRNTIINSIISSIAPGTTTLTSKDGNPFTFTSTQVSGEGLASNGKYYILTDVNLPGSAYRKTFMYEPTNELPPKNPTGTITASVGAKTTFTLGASAAVTNNNSGTTVFALDRYAQFSLNNVGGKIDFTFPFVTKGDYQVVLRYVANQINGCVINTFFNGGTPTTLLQNFDTGNAYTQTSTISVDQALGRVTVAADGTAKFTVQCAASSYLSSNQYSFFMSSVRLVPVD